MKAIRKVLTSMLVIAMVMSTCVLNVFADEPNTKTGTITISNATIGETYTVYKLFDAILGKTYTNTDGKVVTPTSYIATVDQYDELKSDTNCVFDFSKIFDSTGAVSGYQVTVKEGVNDDEVISYIKDKIFSVDGFPGADIEHKKSEVATEGTVKFTELDFGYYFVTSTLGAVVSINTVNPSATIVDKNPEVPDPDNEPDPNEPEKDVLNSKSDSIDGTVVSVGDVLTYEVSFKNTGYYTEAEDGTLASVVIKDAAPTGTELLSAEKGNGEAGNPSYIVTDADGKEISFTNNEYTGGSNGAEIKITADIKVNDGTVTWTFTGVPKDYTVKGYFDVEVTETAQQNEQNKVDNTAEVVINNTFTIETNEVTNYVPDKDDPVKDVKFVENEIANTESDNGKGTEVNGILQYEITWKNTAKDGEAGSAKTVVIEDAAPTGTVYIKDSARLSITDETGNGVTVDKDGKFTTVGGEESTVMIGIDTDGKISWTVDTLPVNYTVTAIFRVEVTKAAQAITDQTIRNTAGVSIDNASSIETNEVHNPVPEDPENPHDPNPGKVIVQSDGTETQVSTGSFGETVTFDLGINAVNYVKSKVDADNDGKKETVLVKEYYIYDKMDPGFTLAELQYVEINGKPYELEKGEPSNGVTTWTADYEGNTIATFYTRKVDSDNDKEIDYTVITGTITWAKNAGTAKEPVWSPLYPNCEVHLRYTATINEKAVIAEPGNINRFKFSYQTIDGDGDKDEPNPQNPDYPDSLENGSKEKTTTTYTYALAIQKISSETGETLAGATFTVTDRNGKPVYGVKSENEKPGYYDYTSPQTEKATSSFVTNADGQIIIKGIDVGTYTFTETKAPDGYARLTESIDVEATMTSSTEEVTTIVTTTARKFAAVTEEEWDSYTGTVYQKTNDDEETVFKLVEKPETYAGNYYKLVSLTTETAETGNIITTNTFDVTAIALVVKNTPGSLLPSTGGIGTTIFYILGVILVLGAGILLVVRRRMRAEQ